MALVKCPRCELNYILDGGELCTVCRKEVRGEIEPSEMPELCSECGENPAVAGGELCMACLKEMNRHTMPPNDDTIMPEAANIGIDSVSTMDEIELDIDDTNNFGDDEFKEEVKKDEEDVVSLDQLAEQDDADEEPEEE